MSQKKCCFFQKRLVSFIIVVIIALTAVGCGPEHVHLWELPTCEKPKTCSECGETDGFPLGHKWEEATCTSPKHCTRCGLEEGEPLNHSWEEATCEKPKRCSRCGSIDGNALGHEVAEYTVDKKPTCSELGVQKGLCSRCGEEVSQSIPMIDHVDDEKWITVSNPTLYKSGKKATHCKQCGKELRTESFDLSFEEKNAYKSAESYLSFMAFSRKGLIHQLEFEGYSNQAATTVVDLMDIDWNEQAAKCAKSYIDTMSFSRSGLIHQLEYEGFTHEQAEYGASAVGY